jgi:hypothetical protein
METRETAISTPSSSPGSKISLDVPAAVKKGPAADEPVGFFQALGRWARYLYFLRFSLALWLFAPALCALNWKDQTLTSGILVPDFWEQYFCIGFFLASAGLAALILARIVLINGPERWDLDYRPDGDGSRPGLLTKLMVNNDSYRERLVVLISQVPNLLVLGYMWWYGSSQGVAWWKIVLGLMAGGLVAGFFWWLPNAWYYLTYRTPEADLKLSRFALGKNAARTILYPRKWFWLNLPNRDLPGVPSIEQARSYLDQTRLSRFLSRFSIYRLICKGLSSQPGYGIAPGYGNSIYESHSFASISFVALIGLYVLIWPLTAPVPARTMSAIVTAALIAFSTVVLLIFLSVVPPRALEHEAEDGNGVPAERPDPENAVAERKKVWARKAKLMRVKVLLTLGTILFDGTVIGLANFTSAERFPIFATVLILVIAVCWTLAGLAFFLDRFRVPVFTLIVLLMAAPRMVHFDRTLYWSGGLLPHAGNSEEEHYLSTTSTSGKPAVPSPLEVLNNRRKGLNDGKPLIIITATGGGLHASAWTAAILAHLEQTLGPDLHKHLLLASTVSGGSVGLFAYLRELKAGTLDDSRRAAAFERMEGAAQCSSLEGVGWGLVYYDLPKAFIPVIPYFFPPSAGAGNLTGTPLLKDRTWSLRRSFERNLSNDYCEKLWRADGNPDSSSNAQPPLESQTGGGFLTLRTFLDTSAFPAFTMNTTAAETGERFLLANYAIPYEDLDLGPNYRARSFLATYGSSPDPDGKFADLPLATAAQMSATFPYVSSAARVPMSVDNEVNSVHFVDGGYYDNDGTASAIEFLHYALRKSADPKPPSAAKPQTPKPEPKDQGKKTEEPSDSLRVLLIEIRNSGDIEGSAPETQPDVIPGQRPWNLFNQIGAPLLGFWQAGHESVTARNQAGLELLEEALGGRLQIHRVVFADLCSIKATDTDPLNWSLTPRQRKEIVRDASTQMQQQYVEAKRWFEDTRWDRNASTEDERLSYSCPDTD